MAEIRVNPTRMEQKKLKARLAVARRGHKLMRDKRDELMRQFLDVVRKRRSFGAASKRRLSNPIGAFPRPLRSHLRSR